MRPVSQLERSARDQLVAATETASYFAAQLLKGPNADPVALHKAAAFLNRGQLVAFARDGAILDPDAPRKGGARFAR